MKKNLRAIATAVLLFTALAFGQSEVFQFEVTVPEGQGAFRIPLNGRLNNNNTKTYDWNIDWGDGIIENKSGTQTFIGISHPYPPGTYTITITPAGSTDAWLGAFGFYDSSTNSDSQTNRDMVTKVISPLTPLMTRTQTQIDNGTAPSYEWAYTFRGCTNLTMGDNFTFSGGWDTITTVGDYFANRMFYNCSGANFTMNEVFNLPQGITTVGNNFAFYMFSACSGANFTMNEVFNLPQGITIVSNNFAAYMFNVCSGTSFTMNSVFNLPQGITIVGEYFAHAIFSACSGASFTMNSVFNLPQRVTTVGEAFAASMFYNCSGEEFMVNNVFKFPILQQAEVNKNMVFYNTFRNYSSISTTVQTRTAASIINGNPASTVINNGTFTDNNRFLDRPNIPVNWGGSGVSLTVTFNSNDGSAVQTLNNMTVGSIIGKPVNPIKANNMFAGWYKEEELVNEWNFAVDVLANDITLHAKWIPAYTVSFDWNYDGGTIFSEDFEGSTHSFTLVNGSQTNKWAVGTAAAYGGLKSAYISNDNGTSNAYTTSPASIAHMYRDVTLSASLQPCTLNFLWRAQGENNHDTLRVSLIEALATPSAGSTMSSGRVLGGYKMGGATVWNYARIIIPASNNGTAKRLLFTWVNDANGGNQPPIAVDNIVLVRGPLPPIYIVPGGTFSEEDEPETSNFIRSGYIHDGKWHTRTGTTEEDYVYTPFIFGEGGTEVTSDTTLYLKWESTGTPSSSSSDETSSSSSSFDISSSSSDDTPSSSSSAGNVSSSSNQITPIRLPQIATANQATQIYNGVNLQVTNNAVIEIYNLNGDLINKQKFGSGVYTVSFGHLPKGMYIVKASFGSEKKMLKVAVR